jgi:serine/threonine protein kinase
MSSVSLSPNAGGTSSLKMVPCGKCGKSIFIPSNLTPLSTTPCPKCGHPVMLPLKLRQFELRSVIASGGMGTVYRSYDTSLEREVAVKLMRREFTSDAALVESFAREAKACAGLNHTNIIHIYAFDEWDGEKYIVMELADCGSVDDRIEKEGAMPELDVLDVGIAVAKALQAASRHNLLHLDIKPGNILYNAEGEPKLVDFGLARKADAEKDEEEGVLGTPYYIAPERVLQTGESFLSDMYSLAATLYHALTGRVPFEGPDIQEAAMAHAHNPLVPPNQVNPAITAPTNEAICNAMAKEPAHRYQSYDEFIMALESARSYLLVQKYRSAEEA